MRIPWRRVVGVVLVLAASGAVAQSYTSTQAHQRYVECQAAVNDALIERTRILTEAAEQERRAERVADDAERRLFTDPVLSKPAAERTQAERDHLAELFRQYQAALNRSELERVEADRARAENPVPQPPSQTCR